MMDQPAEEYLSDEETPEAGRVSEARRAWLLRTDQELAFKLQDDEIVHHLCGNKYRNEQIREDFPTAAAVQAHDEDRIQEEVNKRRHIVEEDARLAYELQRKLIQDKEQKLQNSRSKAYVHHRSDDVLRNGDHEKSSSKLHKERRRLLNEEEYNKSILNHSPALSDVASAIDRNISHELELNAGIESYNEASTSQGRSEEFTATGETTKDIKELELALGIPRKILIEEKERLLQVEKDAEIARLLSNSEDIIQTKDSEYARILQAREVEKYNKSKERQRLRQRQKYSESTERKPDRNYNVVLSDTYCQPRDIIPATYNANEYGDGDGDSHYMEVFPTDEIPYAQDLYKKLRSPPEAPKLSGRPKLAEPGSSIETQNNQTIGGNGFHDTMTSNKSNKSDKKNKKKDKNIYKEKSKCSIQ